MARSHLVVEAMQDCGVTHVVWLPDSESHYMYDALNASPLHLVPVCREGEAFGIAAGLHLGGKTPVVLIQNTGLFESGDVLRGNILNLQMPLLLMVGYRGYHEMVSGQGPAGFRRHVHRADSQRLGHRPLPAGHRRRRPENRRCVQGKPRGQPPGGGPHRP